MHELHTSNDLGALMEDIGNRTVVMLGEASHGTHEYYSWRIAISKRLIVEKGFRFIAVEGDWPDCYAINRFVKGYQDAGANIEEVLKKFDRWPTWMRANWEIASLAEWLRAYNADLPQDKKVGFYGLDVYSLWDSMKEMISYLEREDPKAASTARKAVACFEPFNEDEQLYARHSMQDFGCRDEVIALLKEIRLKARSHADDPEATFSTEQNALVAVNAERYYRSMMGFDNESWNIRDMHMMETLTRLMNFHQDGAKGIVWEHNTHIGDARATGMADAGMLNLGQLARETYGDAAVYLAGFGAYRGTVIAAESWGAPMKVMQVPAARSGSIEAILKAENPGNGYLLFSSDKDKRYTTPINHRAIGVVYNPAHEKFGNYVPSLMSMRYNAFIYFEDSTALHPMHLHPDKHQLPATYPFNV